MNKRMDRYDALGDFYFSFLFRPSDNRPLRIVNIEFHDHHDRDVSSYDCLPASPQIDQRCVS
jgi:hypothetical protein